MSHEYPEPYSHFLLCEKLKPKERCFRLRIYKDGDYKKIYHEHIPYRRLSDDNVKAFMKALIVKYSEWSDSYILASYINKRGKKPAANEEIQFHSEYPEPGVARQYFSTHNIEVMMDSVIDASVFRQLDQS